MRLHVFVGANRALFLAAKEYEADRPPRQETSSLNRARRFNHQCGVTSIVECSRAQLPRIQMRAQNHVFIGLPVSTNFTDNVLVLDRAANLVRHLQEHERSVWVHGDQPCEVHRVSPRNDRLWNLVDFAMQSVGMAVKQLSFPCAHPKNGPGSARDGAFDNVRRAQVFVEEIGPRCPDIAVHEKNTALDHPDAPKFIVTPATHLYHNPTVFSSHSPPPPTP